MPDLILNCEGFIKENFKRNGIFKTTISTEKYEVELVSSTELGKVDDFLKMKIVDEQIQIIDSLGRSLICFEVFFYMNFK
jgi:hypothetical protein